MTRDRFIAAVLAGLCFIVYAGRAEGATLPKIPTGFTQNNQGTQYKPYVITTTGDGSGFYGGRTDRGVEPAHANPNRQLGRLRWTSYTSSSARATGVEWVKFGPNSLSQDPFHIDGAVTLTFSRPVDRVLTRLIVSEGSHSYMFTAQEGGGFWSWQ
ncbi:MAG: hypothetical protein JOZ07_17900 [Solirubrobacterales bacterium]|nr:hypothetical protein [Solirubrobacterales bacterium]